MTDSITELSLVVFWTLFSIMSWVLSIKACIKYKLGDDQMAALAVICGILTITISLYVTISLPGIIHNYKHQEIPEACR